MFLEVKINSDQRTRYNFRHILPCFRVIFKNIKKMWNVTFIYTIIPMNEEAINSYLIRLSQCLLCCH